MAIYEADAWQRAAYIQGLRDFADWLTVNPQAPTSTSELIQLSTRGSDAETRADVDRFAELVGAEAKARSWAPDFYEAALHFGPIKYYAVAITEAWSEEDGEAKRLGREALAAKKAAEHVDEADWEALGDCIADGDDEDRDDQCDGCGNRLDDCTCAPGFVPQEPSMWSDPAVLAAVRDVVSGGAR